MENEERVAIAEFVGVESSIDPGEEMPIVMSTPASDTDIDASLAKIEIQENDRLELQPSESENIFTRISPNDTFVGVQDDTYFFVSEDDISVVAEQASTENVESLSSTPSQKFDLEDFSKQETKQEATVATTLTSADSISSDASEKAEVIDDKLDAKEERAVANSQSELYEPSVARNNYFDNYFEDDSQREAAEVAAAAALTRSDLVSSTETENTEATDVKIAAKEDKSLAEEISEKDEVSLARNNFFDNYFENQNTENSNVASNTNTTNTSNQTESANTSITTGFDMSRFAVAQNADKKSNSNKKKPAKNQNNNQQKKRGPKR